VIKRAFDWHTLDLGYPSAIATLWFIVIFIFPSCSRAYSKDENLSSDVGPKRTSTDLPHARSACFLIPLLVYPLLHWTLSMTVTLSMRKTADIYKDPYGL
jgi:hypothetical protein